MVLYQVLSPIVMSINGDSFKEAIKNFVKLNHRLDINKIIITDQQNHMEATLKYFKHDGRNKVGINYYPAHESILLGLGIYPSVGLPVANVTLPTGPFVGPGHDIGPVVGNVVAPLPTVVTTTPIIRNRSGTRIATSNGVLVRDNGNVYGSFNNGYFIP